MKRLIALGRSSEHGSENAIFFMICILTALALLSGCMGSLNSSKKPQAQGFETAGTTPAKTSAIYFGFEDIQIPNELRIINSKSFVASTPGYRSGVLTLKGMVDPSSLFQFFSDNMRKDNWDVVSQIKSPGIILMVFQKSGKCAVITIRDDFSTNVEIGVAPTLGASSFETDSHFMESDLSQ